MEFETRRGDGGYTLVEMLVTIVMLTLITGSITAVVITSLKHQTSLSDQSSALASVRNSLEQVDRDIRSADPLCYATGNEIAMLKTYPTPSSIVDYSVATVKGVTDLVYHQYGASTTPAAGPVCAVTTTPPGSSTPITTDYYESGSPVPSATGRIVIGDLTGTTSSIFTAPASLTTFDNCVSGGTAPADTLAGAAAAIQVLTLTVSVQPATLHKPVTATDCGTYIRNYGTT
jgi:type II secretory pathway pseudopilin PulG